MYCFKEMIDMGLMEGQAWPTPEHKAVATTIAIGNPNVSTKDNITGIVQSVIKVPVEQIKTITLAELVAKFDCPDVGIYN